MRPEVFHKKRLFEARSGADSPNLAAKIVQILAHSKFVVKG